LDVGKFLSSGTTYVHAAAGSALAKVAAPMLLALALAVPGAQAADRANSVMQMQRPADMLSQVYQSLAAPTNDKLLLVSVNSPEMGRLVKTMPQPLSDLLNKRAVEAGVSLEDAGLHEFSKLRDQDPDAPFVHRLNGYNFFGARQSVSIVSAIESVYQGAMQTRSGQLFVSHTPPGFEHVQPLREALHETTVHELAHAGVDRLYASAAAEAMDRGGVLYGMAVDEMLADLAVVMHYASVDGDFVNGLASVKSLRAAGLADVAHNTEDMLEHALAGIDPAKLQGIKPAEIYDLINHQADALDPLNNQVLQRLFAKSALEKIEVGMRVFGGDADVMADYRAVMKAFPVRGQDLDVPGRASKTLDAMLTGALRNPDLHRELGTFSMAEFQDIAGKMGVELTASQIQRIAVVDGNLTPVGSPNRSPFESDRALEGKDYFTGLLRASGVERVREALPDYSR
jgi:hypothetical protein